MVDEEHDPVRLGVTGKTIRFSGTVSLGNLLIMVGMLAGGGSAIFVVGTAVQRVQDAVVSETEIRTQSVSNVVAKIDSLAAQETRDVGDLKMTMSDIRADMRSFMHYGATPPR